MAYKDILLHLDPTPGSQQRMRLALDLARRHQAHLTAICVVDVGLPMVAMADAGGGAAVVSMMEQMRSEGLSDAATVEAAWREQLRREGLNGEWRLVEGLPAEEITLHARYADLVILGQENPDNTIPGGAGLVGEVLLGAGCPVLVVPYAGEFPTLGRRVLIGWNASRESARAVADAMPLLKEAETTTILAANPRKGITGHGEEPGADIALHLARHGLSVTAVHRLAPDVPDADLLLNEAADMAADLIVVGGFGHSRLREWVWGGVTRTLLQQMTAPVLLSH